MAINVNRGRTTCVQGTTLIGTATASPNTVTWNSVATGSYSLTARATDNLGAATTSAARTITVTTNQAPTVSLTAPAAGASFVAPAAITLTATAADTDGTIAKVEFFQGTTLVGTVTTAPYTVTWNNVQAGSYSLTARATDNLGAVTTSAACTISVNATNTLPTVSLTAPADGAVYTLPVTVTVSATADGVEVDTPITRVDFYQGTTLIGSGTASPFTLAWTPTTAGSYSLTAKATDSAGGVTISAARTVTVQAGNQSPSVSLTSPLANQSFTAPATVTLSATASDADGSIAQIEFFQGATLIGSVTTAPYSVVWNNVPAGGYSLTAKATDNLGSTRSSPAVLITVTGSGPTVLYLHGDHLGTPRAATNEANVVVWRNLPTGEPFGMALPEEDPDGDGRATVINLRFPGQYFDRETQLHYNYFRDYDPGIGRYLQSDPIGLAGGVNTYAYVESNPVSYVDPNGLAKCRYSISPPGLVCTPNNPQENDAGFGIQGDMVFSGDRHCKNNPSEQCEGDFNDGPIPPGCYNVIAHESKPGFWRLIPTKGWSKVDAALYRLRQRRGGFMLHPGSVSYGCVTVDRRQLEQYQQIDGLLRSEAGNNVLCVSR